MVAQHVIKVVAFGLLGFNYGPYAGLVVAMIASSFVGKVVGTHVLVKMNDVIFHRVLAVLLSVLALRLDGKSVVSGKSVSVRVEIGGCGIFKKQRKNYPNIYYEPK